MRLSKRLGVPQKSIWTLALILVLFMAALLSAIWMQADDRLNDTLSILACVSPLALFFFLPRKNISSIWEPSAGLLISVSFLVFFTAGLVQYWLNDREIGFAVIGPVDSSIVRDTLIGCALISCMLIVGDRLGRIRPPQSPTIAPSPRRDTSTLAVLSQILWCLACLGCYDVANSLGGMAAASSQLALHDRNVGIENAGTLGMSLWGIFALPSVTALFVVSLDASRTKRFRFFALCQAVIVLAFGLSMFGSRLLLILSFVALAFSYFSIRKSTPPLKVVVALFVLLMLISTAVLGGRAQALNTTNDTNFLDSVGYSIFDVSIAAVQSLEQLRPEIGSFERGLTTLSAALPGSGGRSAEISAARIDVIVVQAIGTAAQAKSSGLPPSLATSLFLGFALPYAMLIAMALGIIIGFITRWLAGQTSPLAFMLYGLWGSFLFNAFKGGDFTLDVGSEARRWVYVITLYAVISIVMRDKESQRVGCEKNNLRSPRISDHNADVRRKRGFSGREAGTSSITLCDSSGS